MYTFRSSVCDSSDLPGFDPTTLNGMILSYHLMTKWSGLGDSMVVTSSQLDSLQLDSLQLDSLQLDLL
jgi:hypothetical protein